jgi:hypothetical protein
MILGKFEVFPNPMSPEFNQEAEIKQYEAIKYYGNECFKKYTVKSAAELASTKSEGLLSVGSLMTKWNFDTNSSEKILYEKIQHIQ